MKKMGILNREISDVIAGMGHTQELVISDAGFPIPEGTRRIDLALEEGKPSFIDTLKVVLKELAVEKIIIAEETKNESQERYEEIIRLFPDIEIEHLSHIQFKEKSTKAKAIIRTGEFTPYSNIILVSGVVY